MDAPVEKLRELGNRSRSRFESDTAQFMRAAESLECLRGTRFGVMTENSPSVPEYKSVEDRCRIALL